MNSNVFNNISKIIERDSKSTTYKFALLRGVIDIIQDNSPFIRVTKDRVYFPLGLLIEKWLIYYYPILSASEQIPQIHGKVKLAFEPELRKIIAEYESINGLSSLYNDLRNKSIPTFMEEDFIRLARKLRDTITRMPMKYIGRSISNEYYSIFNVESLGRIRAAQKVDIYYLVNHFGTFSIPVEYYEAFKVVGSFVGGRDSILFKWAEFSVKASDNNLSIENVLTGVLKGPITEREILASKRLYRSFLEEHGKVYCVWTGKALHKYDIDHVIPFSAWRNNDLWNLLPSYATINKIKRDKIPSTDQIDRSKDLILYYWDLINQYQPERFQKEIQIALLGKMPFPVNEQAAIDQLKKSCDFMIGNRGYQAWSLHDG
jgi:hypothetical protein